MKNVFVSNNYFIQDALGYLRDKHSDMRTFRYFSQKLIRILVSEALAGLKLKQIKVTTQLQKTDAKRITDEFVLIPILRAGLSMLNPALEFLPEAKVGFAGLARDELTAVAREYYWKMPGLNNKVVLILDPMLATGGSTLHVLRKLRNRKVKEIRSINIVCAPEGIKAVHQELPEVKIFTSAVDLGLNSNKFILPGVGDFGDRYFGTKR